MKQLEVATDNAQVLDQLQHVVRIKINYLINSLG